jgi:hypothetical protein
MTQPRRKPGTTGRVTAPKRPFSAETLNVLGVLLSQVTLSPTADGFLEQAQQIDTARQELLAEMERVIPHITPAEG